MINFNKFFVSLRSKIILYFLFFVLIPITLLWLVVSLKISNDKLINFQLLNKEVLDNSDNSLNMFLKNINEDILLLSKNEKIKSIDNSIEDYLYCNEKTFMNPSKNGALEKDIFNILKTYSIDHSYVTYSYIGTKFGGFVQYPEDFVKGSFDPRKREWYKKAINNPEKIILSKPYTTYVSDIPVVTVSYTIKNSSGEVYGVLGIDVSLYKLTELLKNIKIGKTGFLMLIDNSGTILANPKDNSIDYSDIKNLNAQNLKSVTNDSMINKTVKINNTEFIANTRHVPETSWTIISLIEKSEYLKSIYSILLVTIIVFLFSIFIIVISSILITSNIITPINKLKKVSIDIANGYLDRPVSINSNDEIGELGASIEIMREKINEHMADNKNYQKHIHHMAFYDSLTNLPNRVLFIDKLKNALEKSLSNNTKGAVMFLDLDNFKNINDTLGHSAGDELVKNLSNTFIKLQNENITIARFGGDEFTFLIENVDTDDLLKFIEQLKDLINSPIFIGDKKLFITSSIGVTIFPEDSWKIDDILKNADTAMYKAKEFGKNTFRFFNKSMKEEMLKKVEIAHLLREAINKELYLYYQPQLDLKTNKIKGFEVLIRWIKPDGTMISPDEFIPEAEKTALIIPIGEWVIRNTCLFIKKLEKLNLPPVPMSINLSVLQLKENNFTNKVISIINELNIDPKLIEFEITESMLIDSFDSVIHILNAFIQNGITISLDDFGTGYSSLNYLTKLPISYVKIDKSFIVDITSNPLKHKITGSIIELAHNIGIKITAEGIENTEQLTYLKNNHCDIIQGYLFSKPLPEKETIKFFKNYLEHTSEKSI